MAKSKGTTIKKLATSIGLFVIFASSLVLMAPRQAAAANYPDPDGTCLTNNGNFNAVIMVKVIEPDGSWHYADHFKFKVNSYKNTSASAAEEAIFNNYSYNSIIYRHNGRAEPKGNSTHTLEVQRSGGDMVAGEGNACKPNNSDAGRTGRVAAYAFRDGDGTSLNCFPTSANSTRTGCGYDSDVRSNNNGSWVLSCLTSAATAYTFSIVDVYGEDDGNWVAGQTGVGNGDAGNIHTDWNNAHTAVSFESAANSNSQELNNRSRSVIFTYKVGGSGPVEKHTTVTAHLTPPSEDVEPTQVATFKQSATVTGFPVTNQWGWNEKATQNANRSNVNHDAHKVNYDASQGGQDGYVAIYLRCGDDSYQTNCSGHGHREQTGQTCTGSGKNKTCTPTYTWYTYHCDGGAYRDSCGNNYAWSCGSSSGINGDTTPNACKRYDYYCKNSSGVYYSGNNYAFRDQSGQGAGRCTASDTGSYDAHKWVCDAPSKEGPHYGADDANFNCLVYHCAYRADVSAYWFYEPAGNDNGEADNHCEYRCDNGVGDRAPLAQSTNKYGDGDIRCYIQPSFTIQCRFTEPGSVTTTQQVVTRNGDYCAGQAGDSYNKSAPAGTYGMLCQTTQTLTGGWSSPPPGKGKGNDPNAYRATWSIDDDTDRGCIHVVAKPIAKVNGGDVAVGGGLAGICTSHVASIAAWPGISPVGSSSTLGAFATGNIDGFTTAVGGSTATEPVKGLTFANTWGATSGDGVYGGAFGTMPCVPNYYGNQPATTPTAGVAATAGAATDGAYSSGATTMATGGGITVPKGSQKTLYVDGNLVITGSGIRYDRAGWVSIDDIPALKVVVRGNIYISSEVAQLDGVYVAQVAADGLSGGHIFTCTYNSGASGYRAYSDESAANHAQWFASCQTPLTINGVFVAKQVHLDRTNGTRLTGVVAEQFNYLPELWLGQWPADNSATSVKYDSIISLPPVL